MAAEIRVREFGPDGEGELIDPDYNRLEFKTEEGDVIQVYLDRGALVIDNVGLGRGTGLAIEPDSRNRVRIRAA